MAPQQHYRECIDACSACAIASDLCETACLNEPDPRAWADCIRINHDCSEISQLAILWMQRGSPFAPYLCELCAMVSDACRTESARHKTKPCQTSAEACEHCSEVCRRFVGGAIPESCSSIGVTG